MVSVHVKQHSTRAQELFESGGGCPGLPVPNSPYGLCGRKAKLKKKSLIVLTVSVEVKQHRRRP